MEENRCALWSKADISMKGRIIMTEFPKRARTIRLENDILIFDGERTIEMPELTMEIMEKLADYKPVGFYVKNNALTDELLMPFIGSKNMVNFGVEYGRLTDVCFSVFATMPKLRYLLLDGNRRITGSSLNVMKECKIDLLTLNHTGLNDNGLLQAASIPKLTHIQIDHTAVTYEGLLNIANHPRIEPISKEQFNQEQMDHFSKLQREKAKKTVKLDQQAVEECQKILKDFFEAMTIWEKYVSQKGFEDEEVKLQLMNIWEQYVSEKPRLGYRPLALSYSPAGTYSEDMFIDAEQLTKNKLYIYTKTKSAGFERRFLMKRIGEKWKIEALQERLDGWQRIGL